MDETFGRRVFVDVIKLNKDLGMRSSWIFQGVKCYPKRHREDQCTNAGRRKAHVSTGAGGRVAAPSQGAPGAKMLAGAMKHSA